MSTEIVYLENFFTQFDTNLVGIALELNNKVNETYQQIECYFKSKQVELELNESRENLLLKLNKLLRGRVEYINKAFYRGLNQFVLEINDSLEYSSFKSFLLEIRSKLHDCSVRSNILNEIVYISKKNKNIAKFEELITRSLDYTKDVFRTNESEFDVAFTSDVVVRNDFINLAKFNYFSLYNTFEDPRLAGEILAHDFNSKVLPISPHQKFVYAKSFSEDSSSSNGKNHIRKVSSNGTQLVCKVDNSLREASHFMLTSSYLVAVYFDITRLKYSCELYDLRLNLIRACTFRKEVNLIEIDENKIELKALYNEKVIDVFSIASSEFNVQNQHLKNRILFSCNTSYKIKIRSNHYLFKRIDSSRLQAVNKSLVLAYSHMIETNILLEFASSDEKHYEFMHLA